MVSSRFGRALKTRGTPPICYPPPKLPPPLPPTPWPDGPLTIHVDLYADGPDLGGFLETYEIELTEYSPGVFTNNPGHPPEESASWALLDSIAHTAHVHFFVLSYLGGYDAERYDLPLAEDWLGSYPLNPLDYVEPTPYEITATLAIL